MLRTKTGAVLLAFFFTGDFGAHWFYLGEPSRGWFYPLGHAGSFVITMIGLAIHNGIGDCLFWFGLLMYAGVYVSRVYDFFHLLCMHQYDFDALYNMPVIHARRQSRQNQGAI